MKMNQVILAKIELKGKCWKGKTKLSGHLITPDTIGLQEDFNKHGLNNLTKKEFGDDLLKQELTN